MTLVAVIVNYETSAMVQRCVESLRAQETPCTIVVVDNPSPAGDAANLEGLGVQVIRNEQNIGYGRACNVGAQAVPGADVLILNPDTVVPPGALSGLLAVMEREAGRGRTGMLAPRLLNENGTVQRSTYQFLNPLNYWLYHSIFGGAIKQLRKRVRLGAGAHDHMVSEPGWVMGAAMLVPRPVWDEVGGFGANYFLYGEDTDLCWRVRAAGHRVLFTSEVSIVHTQGEPSAERRGAQAVLLFRGIRTFLHQHYGLVRRLPVEACVVADMLIRIAIFAPLAVVRPANPIHRSRLRGCLEILKLYLAM